MIATQPIKSTVALTALCVLGGVLCGCNDQTYYQTPMERRAPGAIPPKAGQPSELNSSSTPSPARSNAAPPG